MHDEETRKILSETYWKTPEKNQSFTELLTDATHLLLDHPKEIRELIYWALKLDDEERAALILAYRNLEEK